MAKYLIVCSMIIMIASQALADKTPGRIGAYVTFRNHHLNSPHQLRELMRELKSSGVDFILPFTAKHTLGTVNWDSEIAPEELIGDRTYMEKIVKYAHSVGLKVYPVVCVVTEGGEAGPNAILQKNPSWCYVYEGEKKGYVDPGNPEARKYILSLITELVSNYDIDGLSLDYMRSPNRVAYTESGRDYFRKKHGVDLADIVALSPDVDLDTEGGRKALGALNAAARQHPIWPEWRKWRNEMNNQWVKEIRQAVDKVKPGLPISSYCWGHTTYTRNYEACQDWVTWIEKGYIDWINPTGYRYTDEEFLDNAQRNRELIPKDFPFYVTIGVATSHGRLETADDVIRQMKMSKEAGADGVIFFRWHSLQPFLPEVADVIGAWPDIE